MGDGGDRLGSLLGSLAAGDFVRASGDPDEEERLRRERVEARAKERARAARLRGLG